MSRSLSMARSLVPSGIRRSLKGPLTGIYHFVTWPLKTPLGREILGLEGRKKAEDLRELEPFGELKTSAWLGLEGIAYEMVRRYRPQVIVELGTHMGLSALAMGLALRDLGEGGRLFAVDSWEGDPQAGLYSNQVYDTFLDRIEKLGLGSTIIPLKMYFDEARDKIPTPIDLLHIDGLHTWEAVNHDFDTFGPLVRPGGLVIFHDVNTGFEDLRRFWAGTSKAYESHTVPYSNGLGILRTKSNGVQSLQS
jgi:O-antigen biosynthesis protein